ncbi:ABC transporter permease [Desulfonema ishimotonii]|uniref:ABC transporter permease n=1 Tax=Desulfonema ishimotonii TaxID=45657 RepID=A0A401FXD2_9BACT|nr:lipoprotein-releasing ABC transporter permease subunit [Desulfonema ishimotonii]GBC61662.1 ABC transporter permease [Desulfonema ishimotonii]
MSYEFFIGRRYFRAKGKQAVISLISFLSTVGVAVGVMVMIVVIAVMSGAEVELRNRMISVTSHLVVMHQGGPFSGYPRILEQVTQHQDVEAATPYMYAQAMLRSQAGIFGSVLRGIDPETAGKVIRILPPDLLRQLTGNSLSSDPAPIPGIILGKELASRLKVGTGDLVSLTVPGGSRRAIGQVPAMRRLRVVGTFESGLYEFDKSMAYITLADIQKILRQPDTITGIEVRVRDLYQAGTIAEDIMKQLKFPYWSQDWMQTNRNLFSALKLQKTVMFIILTLIILVSAFNIASALIMMVMEKTGDIAILKAMGATDRSIRKIFVFKGMVIGVVGTFFGAIGGFVICFLIKRYEFIRLPTDVYFFPTLPVSIEAPDVIAIVLATLAICFFATLYPAHRAVRLNPIDALRYGG